MPTPAPLPRCAAALALLAPVGLLPALAGCDSDRGGVVEHDDPAAVEAEAQAYGELTSQGAVPGK